MYCSVHHGHLSESLYIHYTFIMKYFKILSHIFYFTYFTSATESFSMTNIQFFLLEKEDMFQNVLSQVAEQFSR